MDKASKPDVRIYRHLKAWCFSVSRGNSCSTGSLGIAEDATEHDARKRLQHLFPDIDPKSIWADLSVE